MRPKILQMKAPDTAENFHRKVETMEASVSFDVKALDTEGTTDRLCVVELPNQGAHAPVCRAYLTLEHIDELIAALNAYKALP